MIRNKDGRHEAATSKWKRKVWGVPVVGWIVGLALPALAIVGFVLLFGANGTVTSSNGLDVSITAVATANPPESAGPATCSITENPEDELAFAVSGFDPGDICRATIELSNNSTTEAAEIEGFLLDSADFAGGAILVELEDCAKGIVAGGQSQIVVYFTGSTAITPSQTFTFDPAVDGLSVVPVGTSDPSKCEIHTP